MADEKNLKVAVLFHRVGPYHFARLRAVGQLISTTAIELSGNDHTYAWDVVGGAVGFKRLTLFPDNDSRGQPSAEVARRVQSALDECQPDAVVIPGWAATEALSALLWCLRTGAPAVVMSDSTAWDGRRVPWKEWVKARVIRMCSAGLVAGTPHKDYMVKLGMPVERIFLGYDAVDNRYFQEKAEMLKTEMLPGGVMASHSTGQGKQPGEVGARLHGPGPGEVGDPVEYGSDSTGRARLHGPGKSEIRNKYGLPEKYFLASARFVEKKNLSRLIEAYARYRVLSEKAEMLKTETLKSESSIPSTAPWDLVLLGDGPLRSTLNSQLSTLNLHAHVLLPGFKQYPDLPAYYGLANAFIHASTVEPWGLVVNEAMASGLPVLVSNRCGCAPDLVKDGVNGFTFDPYNIEQLAQLMFQISAFQPFRLSAFGDASREIVSAWGPDRFAQGLKAAAECALTVGPKRASWFDHLLLSALLLR